jgi:hypothetical protein
MNTIEGHPNRKDAWDKVLLLMDELEEKLP